MRTTTRATPKERKTRKKTFYKIRTNIDKYQITPRTKCLGMVPGSQRYSPAFSVTRPRMYEVTPEVVASAPLEIGRR